MLASNTLYTHNNKKEIVAILTAMAFALAITRYYVPCVVQYIDTRPIITAIVILLIGVLCLSIASNNAINMSDNVRPHIKERFCDTLSKLAINNYNNAFSYAKYIEDIDTVIARVKNADLQACFDKFFTYIEVAAASFQTCTLLDLARLFETVSKDTKAMEKLDIEHMQSISTKDECAKYLRLLLPGIPKETSSALLSDISKETVRPAIKCET